MPNNLVQAAAEGLPKLTRRLFLGGTAVASLPAAAAAASITDADRPSPEQRIAAAVKEIEEAMAERFPGFKVSAKLEDVRPSVFKAGEFTEGEINRSMVMIYAYEDRYGPEDPRWFVDDSKSGEEA
jgi:hypothetical protein